MTARLSQALAQVAAIGGLDLSDRDQFPQARVALESLHGALIDQGRRNVAVEQYRARHGCEPSIVETDAERACVIAFGAAGADVFRIVDEACELLASFGASEAPAPAPAAEPVRSDETAPAPAESEREEALERWRTTINGDCGVSPPARPRRRRNRRGSDDSP